MVKIINKMKKSIQKLIVKKKKEPQFFYTEKRHWQEKRMQVLKLKKFPQQKH